MQARRLTLNVIDADGYVSTPSKKTVRALCFNLMFPTPSLCYSFFLISISAWPLVEELTLESRDLQKIEGPSPGEPNPSQTIN